MNIREMFWKIFREPIGHYYNLYCILYIMVKTQKATKSTKATKKETEAIKKATKATKVMKATQITKATNSEECKIPFFTSIDNFNNVKRDIYVLDYPDENGYWTKNNKILFFKSSGISNKVENITSGTWFPFYGIINENNKNYFHELKLIERDKNTGEISDKIFDNGYFIKFSILNEIIYKIFNFDYEMRIEYFNRGINQIVIDFMEYMFIKDKLKELEEELKDNFIIRLNDYFTEVNQIAISIWLDEKEETKSKLWENRHYFVEYIKKEYNYYEKLLEKNCIIDNQNTNDNFTINNDEQLLNFIKRNGFTDNYPVENIKKIFSPIITGISEIKQLNIGKNENERRENKNALLGIIDNFFINKIATTQKKREIIETSRKNLLLQKLNITKSSKTKIGGTKKSKRKTKKLIY